MNASLRALADLRGAAALLRHHKPAFQNATDLAGRVLLASLFLVSGLGKLEAYNATAAFMTSAGVPGALLPVVIATEILGALAIAVGWKTRVVAFLLAGYSVLTALTFHHNFDDQAQMINFLKNLSIAGGFLLLVTRGAGFLSMDRRLARSVAHPEMRR